MRMFVKLAMVTAIAAATSSSALAESKKASAPGHDGTCLVTTKTAGSFNDTDLANAKWLPRKAAEAQASQDPEMMRVFDYEQDPLFVNKTYASAEELCKKHFN